MKFFKMISKKIINKLMILIFKQKILLQIKILKIIFNMMRCKEILMKIIKN